MKRFVRTALSVVLVAASAVAASAQSHGRTAPLYDALGFPALLDIMRDEGRDYATELGMEMFPTPGGTGWEQVVDRIYEKPRLEAIIQESLAEHLADSNVEPMVAFFTSPVGQRIIELEIAAREAMLDPTVDEAARDTWADLQGTDDPRLALLEEFANANSLIDNNVVGAMNSNYAFYIGLSDGGAFGRPIPQEEILADVWSQEETIRADTEEWMYSYLLLAYQPLTDEEVEAYLEFSRTEAGQQVNQAIFYAFDEMFKQVSQALGTAAAGYMSSQEL